MRYWGPKKNTRSIKFEMKDSLYGKRKIIFTAFTPGF